MFNTVSFLCSFIGLHILLVGFPSSSVARYDGHEDNTVININNINTQNTTRTIGFNAARENYDVSVATNALYFSKAAYCAENDIQTWTCGAPCAFHPSMKQIKVYANSSYDTLGFSGYNADTNRIIASFRGSNNIDNWISNLDILFMDYPIQSCSALGKGQCKVHQGFFGVYRSLLDIVTSDLLQLMQAFPNANHVLFTGHSLGGAISLLAGVQMASLLGSSSEHGGHSLAPYSRMPLYIYTFGCPRVGNDAFATWASTLALTNYRHTHRADIVPHIPPELVYYRHTTTEVFYPDVNNSPLAYTVCSDSGSNEDPSCSNSITFPTSVDDHLHYMGKSTGCNDE